MVTTGWRPITTAKKGERILMLARFTDDYRKRLSTTKVWDVFTGQLTHDGSPSAETVIHPTFYNITAWQPLPAFPD